MIATIICFLGMLLLLFLVAVVYDRLTLRNKMRVVDPIPPSGFGGCVYPHGYQPRVENCPVNPGPPQSVSASTVYHDDPIELDPNLLGDNRAKRQWRHVDEETIRRIVREELAKQKKGK